MSYSFRRRSSSAGIANFATLSLTLRLNRVALLVFSVVRMAGLDTKASLDEFALDRWNWRQGLPQETLTSIRQSSDGYLWIATANGLFRFNGSRAVEVPLPRQSISDRRLRTLEADDTGSIWVMASSGALWKNQAASQGNQHGIWGQAWQNLIPAKPGGNHLRLAIRPLKTKIRILDDAKFVDYPVPETTYGNNSNWKPQQNTDLPAASIASAMDSTGQVFAVGQDGQVSRMQPGGDWKELFRLTQERIHLIQCGGQGVLWMRTGMALYRWKAGKMERWALPDEFVGASTYYPFIEDQEGTVWLGGRGGILRLQDKTLSKLSLGAELQHTPVSALFEDREGALWVGTLNGVLLRLRDSASYSVGRAEGLAGDIVNSVLAEEAATGTPEAATGTGAYWTHSMNQGLTLRQNDGTKIFAKTFEGHFGNLWFLARDPATNRMVAGNGEKQVQIQGQRLVDLPDPFERELGRMSGWWRDPATGGYVVARSSGLYRQPTLFVPDAAGPKFYKKISTFANAKVLAFGSEGRIWVSDGQRLEEIGVSASTALDPPEPQWDDQIFCLRWEPASQRLWVGTSRGLLGWNPDARRWSQRAIDGDQVFLLQTDQLGSLWAATRRGLIRLRSLDLESAWQQANRHDFASPAPLRLLHADGLRNLNFGMTRGQGSARLPNGKLLFASMGGLVVLDPTKLPHPRFAPSHVVEEILGGESGTMLRPDGVFPAGTRRVEIRFDAFAVSTNSPVQLDYLLAGVDERWQRAGDRRTVQYTNLRPGQYKFHLRAGWPDGSGTSEKTVQWEILPLLHERAWFPWAVTACASAAVLALWRRSQAQRRQREKELEERVAERTQELFEAKRSADRAAQVKSEFLATMSHELRTPMNGVLGLAELLQSSNLTTEQMDLVNTLRVSGESLLALVNDILDLSRLESGRFELERIPVHIPGLIAETLKLIEPLAQKKGLKLRLASSGEAMDWIETDPIRIRQILMNLLSNAIKFTSKGEVSIDIRWSAGELRVDVRDTGIGIPADKITQLFENFVQVDSSTSRLYGGTGLGLAISKKLAEAMQGTVHCQSELGVGSCFSLWLPVQSCPGPQVPATIEQDRSLAGLEVLIAEDNLTNQRVIMGLLNKLGLKSRLVSNGLEALQVMQQESFDLVLMDCQMPHMDGYEATQQIRALLGENSPPIIALTAHALASDRIRCLQAGMTGYLTKPVSLERLRQAIWEANEPLRHQRRSPGKILPIDQTGAASLSDNSKLSIGNSNPV